MNHPSQNRSKRKNRDRGAVMLVVMLMLLMATSTATFAMHATSSELRAAGYTRLAFQAEYVGETGVVCGMALVDELGAAALQYALLASENDTSLLPSIAGLEPPLLAGKRMYRMHIEDFTSGNVLPPDGDAVVGSDGRPQQLHTPDFVVDVSDDFVYTGAIAGQRADGYGRLQFMYATYTSRGRMELPSDVEMANDTRGVHESASDARAFGLSGPFGR